MFQNTLSICSLVLILKPSKTIYDFLSISFNKSNINVYYSFGKILKSIWVRSFCDLQNLYDTVLNEFEFCLCHSPRCWFCCRQQQQQKLLPECVFLLSPFSSATSSTDKNRNALHAYICDMLICIKACALRVRSCEFMVYRMCIYMHSLCPGAWNAKNNLDVHIHIYIHEACASCVTRSIFIHTDWIAHTAIALFRWYFIFGPIQTD